MMKTVFADAFYFLALVNARDASHQRCLDYTIRLTCRMITTSWILTEVADALSHPVNRPLFIQLIESLVTNPMVEVVPPSEAVFAAGVKLFSDRPDKGWSLTDCISMHVMTERGVSHALTGDRHFVQAGFTIEFP